MGGGPEPVGVERMFRGMAKFGHGPAQIWHSGCVELGRRLIATVPEDAADRQPYLGRDGSLCLVADIRLDNRDELAGALGLGPADVASLADADLLMRAWERFGPGCLDRLVGDYAFAIWDAARRRLLLVRDPVGSRPLFYHEGKDFFAFASMPSGLLALPAVPYALDEECLARGAMYLPGRIDRSFFQNIKSVRAGEMLAVGSDGISRQQYWHPEDIKPLRFRNPHDYAEVLREALDRAVLSQMRGLGEVAAQLSGGLDSTCIVATAARLLAPEGRRLAAFTAAPCQGYDLPDPPGRLSDESGQAGAVAAEYLNIDHFIRRGADATPFDSLDRYFSLFQQPTVNLCNHVWMEDIWRAAAGRGLNVMLTGLLGNATISYRDTVALRSLAAPWQWPALAGDAIGLVSGGHATLRGIVAALLGPLFPARLWAPLKRGLGGMNRDPAMFAPANPALWHEWHRIQHGRPVDADGRIKYGQDLRLLILNAMDIAPMNKGVLAGWGVDQRHPAADRRVIETCLAIPQREFVRNGIPAAIYRRTFADRVPPAVLEERRRGLQAPDWYLGLAAGRAKLLDEIGRIETDDTAQRFLDLPKLRHLAETLPDRAVDFQAATPALRLVLLRGISLGHFIRRAGEGRSALIGDDLHLQELH